MSPVAADIATDPFVERGASLRRITRQILGGTFAFASESAELMRLVRSAYDGLPQHQLPSPSACMRVRLVLGERAEAERRQRPVRSRSADDPGPFAMLSGPGLLCGASGR